MKKRLVFGLSVAAAMVGAAALRRWQRATAFEVESGLLTPGKGATYCLVALVLVAAVGFLLLGRWVSRGIQRPGYLASFALPFRGAVLLYVLSGALLVAAGVLGIMDHRLGIDQRLSRFILSICLCPAGVGVVLAGWLNAGKEEAKGRFAWPLLIPGYGGCVWLIACYQDRATEPNVMSYVFYLLGAVCAVLCCYTIASFSFEKPRSVATLWLGSMALMCLGMSVAADFALEERNMETLISLGYMIYLAAQMGALVKSAEAPATLVPWAAGGDQPDHDNELEESDYE